MSAAGRAAPSSSTRGEGTARPARGTSFPAPPPRLGGSSQITGHLPLLSPRTHRRVDRLSFPALLATAALLSHRERVAGSVALMTAAVEGTAHLITDDPPAILPWISFRPHNRWAFAHGLLVATLALTLPGLAPRNRWALGALAAMPIVLAEVSDTRHGCSPPTPATVAGPRDRCRRQSCTKVSASSAPARWLPLRNC